MKISVNDLSVSQRAVTYRLLSGLFFRELSEEQLDSYRSGEGRELLNSLAASAEACRGFKKLVGRLESETELDLACEFSRLFLGAGGSRSVPPYASVFTSEHCSTHQQAETDAARFMADYGFGVHSETNEPADHVAVLLEFMAFLCVETEASREERVTLARQKNFVENHLLNWVPEFVEVCRSAEPDGFYPYLAGLALSFLEADRDWLEGQLSTAVTIEMQ